MPISPTYPGVYVQELPSGVRTITGVATSITAFLGRTLSGPVNEPTTLYSYGDFERIFGGLALDLPLSYAVRDFFLNGGSQALVVRLFGANAALQSPNMQGLATNYGPTNPSVAPIIGIPLAAASAGTWGNGLSVDLDTTISPDLVLPPGLATNNLFNLTVKYTPAGSPPGTKPQTEMIRNLSVKEGPRRVDRLLPIESQFLQYDPSSQLDPQAPPVFAAGTSVFTGGTNSVPLLDFDYQGVQNLQTGLYALDKADLFNLLCIPWDVRGTDTTLAVYTSALAYCVERRAMLVVDPSIAWNSINKLPQQNLGLTGPDARNAAIYFPLAVEPDPLRPGQLDQFPPCGVVAGIMARTDSQRGVWKAPAGIDATLTGVQDLSVRLENGANGALNQIGINCLRSFPGYGIVVWGSRTMRGGDQLGDEYKYVPVRRLALYIEESLYRGLKWVVFEPNDEPLWSQIRLNVGSFMHDLFRKGALQGAAPNDAYFVKCDKETTNQSDINLGIVNIIVGFAPLKPAEFVLLYLQQMAGQIQV